MLSCQDSGGGSISPWDRWGFSDMILNWYEIMMTEMTEEMILPPTVSWREYADHCLTHDPLPKGASDRKREVPSLPPGQPSPGMLLRLAV